MTREIGTVHDRVEEGLAPPATVADDTLQHYRTANLPYEGLRPQGPVYGGDHIMIPPLYPPGEPGANPAASYPTTFNPASDTGPQKTATSQGDTPAPPAAPPTSPGDTPAPPAAGDPAGPGGQDYVVQPKDSLWKIAEKSLGGTGNQKASPGQIWHQVQNIIQANKSEHPELLKNPNLIHAGLNLHIPSSDNPPGNPSPNNPAKPTTPEIPPGSPSPPNPTQPTTPEAPPDKPSPPGAQVPGDTAQKILAAAACDLGQQEWRKTAGGSSGAHLGCAASVSSVLRQAGVASVSETGVDGLKDSLIRQGWTMTNTPAPGDVVMGYGGLSTAHTGIVGPNGTAWANRSSTGQWKPNSLSYFTNNWDRVFYLRPPQA